MFNQHGVLKGSFGTKGKADGELDLPSSIAIGKIAGKEYLFVADEGNLRLQAFDMNGNFVAKYDGRNKTGGRFRSMKSVFVDSNSKVYIADKDGCHVLVYDVLQNNLQIKFNRVLGNCKQISSKIASPIDLAVDTKGVLYVLDDYDPVNGYAHIYMFDTNVNDRYLGEYNASSHGINFKFWNNYSNKRYRSIAIDQNDQLAVASGDIVIYNNKAIAQEFSRSDVHNISNISFDKKGNLYFSDTALNTITANDQSARLLWSKGECGKEKTTFSLISDIAVRQNKAYISDSANGRIQIINAMFGNYDFGWPISLHYEDKIAMDSLDHLYLCGLSAKNTVVYDKFGNLIGGIGNEVCQAVAIDDVDNLYVVPENILNDIILIYNSGGSLIKNYGKAGTKPGEFNNIYDMFIAKNGFLYVLDDDGVDIFAPQISGSAQYIFRDYFKPQQRATDIAVDSKGLVYLSDSITYDPHVYMYEHDSASKSWVLKSTLGRSATDLTKKLGEFTSPIQGIFIDDVDTLYVAEYCNVHVFK